MQNTKQSTPRPKISDRVTFSARLELNAAGRWVSAPTEGIGRIVADMGAAVPERSPIRVSKCYLVVVESVGPETLILVPRNKVFKCL